MTASAERLGPARPTADRARNQLFLLGAFTVSTVGDWLYRLALPFLVLELTGSAIGAGLAYAVEYAPYVFFSMLGGVAADRFDRRRLLILADLGSALIVGMLAALVTAGVDAVWLVFVVAFAVSSIRPFYHPAFQSILPSLVPAEGLTRANARIQSIESVLSFAGPVLGGAVIAAVGTSNALWLNAVSFLLSALAIVGIRAAVARARPIGHTRIWQDLREAVAYLRGDRVTLWASLLMAGTNVGLLMIEANLIFYLVRLRGLPVAAVGIVFAAFGVGAVLGAMSAPWLCRRFPPGHLIITGMIGAGLMTALLGVLPGLVGTALAWGAVGTFVMLLVVTWFSLRQQIVPQRLLGRVVALSRMLSFATIPPAAAVGGVLLSLGSGAWPVVATSAAVQVGIGLAACATALRSVRFPTSEPEPEQAR